MSSAGVWHMICKILTVENGFLEGVAVHGERLMDGRFVAHGSGLRSVNAMEFRWGATCMRLFPL